MANVRGIRTQDLVSSSLIKREVFDAIFNYKPFRTPITQFFMANKSAKHAVGNPKFELQEDVLVAHSDTINDANGIAGGAATEIITVTDGAGWKVGDVMHPTASRENLRVTAVSTNDITVVKFPAGNITAVANGGTILNLGTAFAEGSASAQAISTTSTFPYNYTQIHKRACHMSGTQLATVNYGGNDWTNQRIKTTEEFKLELELSWVFGRRSLLNTAGANVFTSGGLLDSDSIGISNRDQFVGTGFATESYFFNTFCKNMAAKGSGEKTVYCGSDALFAISEFSKVKQQTTVSESEYGVDIRTIKTPTGLKLNLQWLPYLEGDYSNWCIAVDRDHYMKYTYLKNDKFNRDMQWQDDIGTVGTDEKKSQYLAEVGMELAGGGQAIHRVLYGGA